jgi:hypothetical protein
MATPQQQNLFALVLADALNMKNIQVTFASYLASLGSLVYLAVKVMWQHLFTLL